MQRLIENRLNRLLVLSHPQLMRLDLLPRPLIKPLMTLPWNFPLVPRPGLHQEVLLHCALPKRVVSCYQPKPAFGLGNNVISIHGATEGASRPVVPHHVDIGSHQALIKGRAVPTGGVKTALAGSEHVHVKVKVAEEVVAGGPDPQGSAGHGSCDLALVRVDIVDF